MANPNTAQFPGQIPDDIGLTVASDDFFTTLPVGIGSGDSLFAVNNINFNYPCLVLIDSEIMRVDSASAGNFTVVQRGYLSTTAVSHPAGSTVFGYIFSYHHNQVAAEIKAICAVLGVGGVNFLTTSTPAGGPDITGTYPNPVLTTTGVFPSTYGDATHVSQIIVDSKGRITGAADVTITGAAPSGAAGGDLSGSFPNPVVAKINTVPLGTTAAVSGHILVADGSAWQSVDMSADATIVASGAITLATVNSNVGTFGSSSNVAQITVDGKGRITAAANVAITPGGSAGGDLSGSYPNPTVAKINGVTLGTTTATDKHILMADGSAWQSVAVSGDASVSADTGTFSVDKIKGATLGTTTATDKNILVADGTDWDSVAMSGDATISNTGAVTVTKINGATLGTVTATDKNILVADGSSWQSVAMSGDATITANTGTITLATVNGNVGSFGDATHSVTITVDGKGRITAVSDSTITLGGFAGGDLSGSYPNPTVAKVNGSTSLTLPTYVVYKAAISQAGVASLGVSTPVSAPAVAADSGNSNTILGVAQFASGATDAVQDHFYIPTDHTGVIDIEIIWRAAAITGDVQWNIATAFCANSAASNDPSFNAAQTVTTTVNGTTKFTNSSVKTSLTTTSISSGGLMFWKLFRSSGAPDTMSGAAEVIEIIFTVRRAIAY